MKKSSPEPIHLMTEVTSILGSICKWKKDTEAAFVTAFSTTSKMLKHYKEIAWDTEIWCADEPTHLTHKNGDRFIGRPID